MNLRITLATAAATAAVLALAGPAQAADTGSGATTGASVTAGDRTAELAGGVTFDAVPASHDLQYATTESTSVTVDDLSGSHAGWTVTIAASDLTDGASGSIDKGNLHLDDVGELAAQSGGLEGIEAGTTGSLASPRTLLWAPVGAGVGRYLQPFDLALAIPGDTLAGSYTGTLTVTIAPPV